MKIEAGKKYRTRRGTLMYVDAIGFDTAYVYQADSRKGVTWFYNLDGSKMGADFPTQEDLVTEHRDPERVQVFLHRYKGDYLVVSRLAAIGSTDYTLVGSTWITEGVFE